MTEAVWHSLAVEAQQVGEATANLEVWLPLKLETGQNYYFSYEELVLRRLSRILVQS